VAVYRSNLVPLEDGPRLLVVADVHLATLRDPFIGYVLPSKIHACIESGKRILFLGSLASDVHHLAAASLAAGQYRRVDVGNVEGAVVALKSLENDVAKGTRQQRVVIGDAKTIRSSKHARRSTTR
jgi:hypothetical protein